MKSGEFKKLSLYERLLILKQDGEYVGARDLPLHFVYLYAIHGFFAEVYMLKSLQQIQWIEVQTNKDILMEYVEGLDFRILSC